MLSLPSKSRCLLRFWSAPFSFFEVSVNYSMSNGAFQSENRLFVAVSTTDSYDGERSRQLMEQFLERVKASPVVQSAAAVSTRPIVGGSTGLGFASAEQPDPEGGVPWASWRLITPDYFRTMGIPLLKGRTFESQDEMARDKPLPTIISKRMAEQLWPGEDPIGRRILLWRGQGDRPGDVVGVVGDIRERGLETDPTLAVYFPYRGRNWSPIQFVVQTAGDPLAFAPTLRTLLSELDPNLPLSDIETMDTVLSDSLSARRFNMLLLTIFAGVALLLALAGIYGVQAYSVARRTSEIGIRVALGASGRAVIRQMVDQGMRPVLLGIGLGLAGALGTFPPHVGASFRHRAERSSHLCRGRPRSGGGGYRLMLHSGASCASCRSRDSATRRMMCL